MDNCVCIETDDGRCRCMVCGRYKRRPRDGCDHVRATCHHGGETSEPKKRNNQPLDPVAKAAQEAKLRTSPGWQLHHLIERWLGQKTVAGCGCATVWAKMHRLGTSGCREHLDELTDRLVEVATKREWNLVAEDCVDPASIGKPVPQTRRTRLARLVARATAALPGGANLVRSQCRMMVLLAIRRAERAMAAISG
jgi:hypothetical protein